MTDLADIQKIMGVVFNDQSVLELALVHSSYIHENPGFTQGHNERLEFLGDAILGHIIAEMLYRDFADLSEGEMTKFRSMLVRRETLARVAGTIGLGDYLYLGKGEDASGGRQKKANLAGAMEAVIAAVFLDQGATITRDFVLRILNEELSKVRSQDTGVEYKSRLQEIIQSRQRQSPTYRVVASTGPDHDRRFTVEVIAGDTVLGSGSGKSKKLAETEAAFSALKNLDDGFTP
ncbi:ribonuclease III [Chloroflexota bacterium]